MLRDLKRYSRTMGWYSSSTFGESGKDEEGKFCGTRSGGKYSNLIFVPGRRRWSFGRCLSKSQGTRGYWPNTIENCCTCPHEPPPLRIPEEHDSQAENNSSYWIAALLCMLGELVLILLFNSLYAVFSSEWPPGERLMSTTMPWNIPPALLVLWGVCWMFAPCENNYVANYGESLSGLHGHG